MVVDRAKNNYGPNPETNTNSIENGVFFPNYYCCKRKTGRLDIVDLQWTTNSKFILVATLDKQLNLYSLERKLAYTQIQMVVLLLSV